MATENGKTTIWRNGKYIMSDLTLLQQFEPVVRYTQGEMFAPCAVDEYVRLCSLWLRSASGKAKMLVPAGDLSIEKLAEYKDTPANSTLYLQLVEHPLQALDYQLWRNRPDHPSFQAPGRLARVGLLSRIIDSLFNLSLLLRGTVPGGTAAAAEEKFRYMQSHDSRYVYYGRVVREGGYIILHYLFFYAMNDWRSSFYGVNDHEADWEQVFVYLSEENGEMPVPHWVAYASHDFSGDDLRRRWDDPELQKVNQTHPVVFAGAGSHASYFQSGEYMLHIEPEFMQPAKRTLKALRKFWIETLGQGDEETLSEEMGALFSFPSIDYARGDGLSIGSDQPTSWNPILLTENTAWVENYRGLWGLDTKDPFGGERAPSGPKYNRNGSVRVSWYDPLGWAGLDKVSPPALTMLQLQEKIAALTSERDNVQQTLYQNRETVRLLALEVNALQVSDYHSHLYKRRQHELDEAQEELQDLYAHHTHLTETLTASKTYLAEIQKGNWGSPQAHIRHKHPPEPPVGKQARISEIWAAISGGLLFLCFAILIAIAPSEWLTWVIVIGLIFLAVESTIRGRLANFLLNTTIVMAIITGFILIKDFWWLLLIFGIFALVITMIVENLRELWEK